MKTLKFSYNWNHKLETDHFTTIRLANPYFYQLGETYRIIEQRNKHELIDRGLGQIIELCAIKIDQLRPFMCYLDTGYSRSVTHEIIQKMYPGKDWTAQTLYYMLIKKVKGALETID